MNSLLELASDFLERLADDTHGRATNDAYALALARVFEEDRELADRLRSVDASDVWTLSSAAWWWFLNDAQRRGHPLPEDFQEALYARSRSAILRYKVIEAALRSDREPVSLDRRTLPGWLEHLMDNAVVAAERGDQESAEELLRAFLQDGSDRARDAFAFMYGRSPAPLRNRVGRLLDGVDDRLRTAWLGRS